MILISHRGNTRGPVPLLENNPRYIQGALDDGYVVEIDLWADDTEDGTIFYLGHDEPQHFVGFEWLSKRKHQLIIHCKNIEALDWFTAAPRVMGWNYFWHEKDAYTLTSNGIIWAYPGEILTENSICVMPEKAAYTDEELKKVIGICSDHIEDYRIYR